MIIIDEFGKSHVVPNNYDNKEIITKPDHVWSEVKPNNLLSRNQFNLNAHSTRVNEKRHATLKTNGIPSVRDDGTLKKARKPYNW